MDIRRPVQWDGAMSSRTSPWPAGVPCWAELSVPDPDAARAFYAELLGWDYGISEADDGGYTVGLVEGRAAGAIGPLPEGGETGWLLYFASDDVDATAAAVSENGGTLLLGPGDVGELGRMVVAKDPIGATFGVWQARAAIGAGVVNESGALVWEDLRSTDPDAARSFYRAVFNYTTAPVEMAGPEYTTFAQPHETAPLGGIGPMFGEDGPPHWLLYFAVADIDAAVAAAQSNGGSVLDGDMDSPFGRMARLADPAGAVFLAIQPPEGQPRPDREG
jgi:predicted enzyme related to lactoylglutathione lyase